MALYLPAVVAMRPNPPLRAFADMRKLLLLAWTLVRTGRTCRLLTTWRSPTLDSQDGIPTPPQSPPGGRWSIEPVAQPVRSR
jgi:hypothetical protein